MHILNTVLLALLGGILPALAWLSFWLREDLHPEPRKLVAKAFIFGMLAVPFALASQFIISKILIGNQGIEAAFFTNYVIAILAIILWSSIEELVKYKAAYYSALRDKANDEPIDPMIYMISSALGFAALENTLFIFWPLLAGDSTTAFMTGNLRFIGATMLHVATSAIIGIFASFSFYKSKQIQRKYILWGFFLSITLHTIFNSFIIRSKDFTIISFMIVWIVIIIIIMIFEKVKQIYIKRQIQKQL